MTREMTKALLPVLTAWSEGKSLQFRSGDGLWYDLKDSNPNFGACSPEWRVKPEPREFWVVVNANNQVVHASQQDHSPLPGWTTIHCREVVE